MQAGWAQILLIMVEIFSTLQEAYANREELQKEAESSDEDWDEFDNGEGDLELDEDEDFDDDEGKEYLEQLANYKFYDDEYDSDEELEEILENEDPLAGVDEYVAFRDTFQNLPSFDPTSYQTLTNGLKTEQVDAINEIIARATQRESMKESEKLKLQGGYSFGNASVPTSFNF